MIFASILRDVDETDKVVWWRNNDGFSGKNSYRRIYELKSQNLILDEESLLALSWV